MLGQSTSGFSRPDLLPERLAECLREDIVSGTVPPGERLLEQDIARQCNVSRAPVREALRILEAEGLVSLTPHRGARVTAVSEQEARQVFPVRAGLEALAARCVARRVMCHSQGAIARELAVIDRAPAEMDAAAPAGDATRYYRNGAAFHDALVSAADNAILLRQYEILKAHVRRYQAVMSRVLRSFVASLAEHKGIAQAVHDGDEMEAARLSETHVLRIGGDFDARKWGESP